MSKKAKVVIGTRGSELALWQAHYTRDRLERAGYSVTIQIIKTKGDQIQHLSFDKIEGKGFFTKELEDVLLDGSIDLAVHSCKDLPTTSPDGLTIAAYSRRAEPSDVLLVSEAAFRDKGVLPLLQGAVVGTSSARRKSQLLAFRPDLVIRDIRGNVPTRVQKLRDGQFDAIMLAAAGLNRLELDTSGLHRIDLPPTLFIPAPAQGILAYQIRTNDTVMGNIVECLHDADAAAIAGAERHLLHAFEGGCQMPLGIYAEKREEEIDLWISKATAWDTVPVRVHLKARDPRKMTAKWVQQLASLKATSVFISKTLEAGNYFRTTLEAQGFRVEGRALIGFQPMAFEEVPTDIDWIFFVSKNGVKYYLEQAGNLPDGVRIAAVNSGTANALKAKGYIPDFIGKGGDLQEIAATFDQTSGDRVLFVRAETSSRTVQRGLASKHIRDLIVYRNFILDNAEGSRAAILVFTSPMNVESYFSKYSLAEDQSLVAIGPSTSKALASYGHHCHEATEPTMWSLVDEVIATAL